MCQERRSRAADARLAASSIVPIVLLLLQNLLLRSSSSSSCTSASFCTPLSLCLPPIVFSHAAASLSSRTFSPSLRTRSSSLGRFVVVEGLVRTSSSTTLYALSRKRFDRTWSDISRRNDTQSSQYAFWALFFSSLKSHFNGFPKDFVESNRRQSLPSSQRRHWLPRRGRGSSRVQKRRHHHRVRVVLRVVSSSSTTTHHHPL